MVTLRERAFVNLGEQLALQMNPMFDIEERYEFT